jgi:hypothetical protein
MESRTDAPNEAKRIIIVIIFMSRWFGASELNYFVSSVNSHSGGCFALWVKHVSVPGHRQYWHE